MAALEYKDVDFKDMMFNIRGVPFSAELFELFPVLKAYEEFYGLTPGLKKANVLRYVFLAYDKESPIVKNNKENILKRKYEAAIEAGFEYGENKKFSEFVDRMIRCEDSNINNMTARFLKLQGDTDFAYITVLLDAFYVELPKIQQGDLKNADKVDKIKDKITALHKLITLNDTNKNLTVDIYKFIEGEKRIGLRPEDIAAKIQKGEPTTTLSW